MAVFLQLRTRTKPKTFTSPSLVHLYSISNSADGETERSVDATASDGQSPRNSESPFASFFSDIKERLKQQQPTSPPLRKSPPSSSTGSDSSLLRPSQSASASLDSMRSKLSQFRSPAPIHDPSQHISLEEIYKRNRVEKSGGSMGNGNAGPGKVSVDAIRERLQHIQPSGGAQRDRNSMNRMSLSALKDSLKMKPSNSTGSVSSSTVIGGTGALPTSIFGKEMREKKEGEISAAMRTDYVRIYSYEDLGKKLKELRPEAKESGWFSLEELNERLMRLRAWEEEEDSRNNTLRFRELRHSLIHLKASDEEKAKKSSLQKLDILGEMVRTPAYMMHPPKEHLVEKYFHPDNMSSAEKLKIELAKVRDEFKMSESDCGSARVQVAQLTTKIKHLSSVLHKKDVHSRKGLQAMVQRRKRILKYLRRTDWDSYCFVISKLGLRDNPDHSYKIRTDGQTSSSLSRRSKKKNTSKNPAGLMAN